MTEVPIIDYQYALKNIGGDEESLRRIICYCDEEEFNNMALRLHKGIMNNDVEEMQFGADCLNGPPTYIGAKRLENIVGELQRKCAAKEPMSLILKDYMEFLNVMRELKKEIAKYLKRPVSLNVKYFDVFEKQVKTALPEYFPDSNVVSPVCHAVIYFEE